MAMTYHIESRGSDGIWGRDNVEGGYGNDVNAFATEAEAQEMIEQLRALGPDWAEAEYRVVADA